MVIKWNSPILLSSLEVSPYQFFGCPTQVCVLKYLYIHTYARRVWGLMHAVPAVLQSHVHGMAAAIYITLYLAACSTHC